MVVLVPLKRQADALDSVSDKANGPIVIDALERLNHAGHVMAAEIRHQIEQFVIAAPVDQLRHGALIADLVFEMSSERRPALKAQSRVHRVGAGIDPAPQRLSAGFGERRLHQPAIFHDHDIPAEIAKHGFEFFPQAFAHYGVQALAVVVDHPPCVAQAMLPALQ